MTGARLVQVIVYVRELRESRDFYGRQLGLRLVAEDEGSATYDAGQVALRLVPASDAGIQLVDRHDDASDIVFMVDDILATRTVLEGRGVTIARCRSYEVGAVYDFYDPNGHRLMLYEPSKTALTWPSADKLRAIWQACGRGGDALIGSPARLERPEDDGATAVGLDGKPFAYLFFYVTDANKAFDFYYNTIGLPTVERIHCCSGSCPGEVEGIVKYDAGGLLLSTHHEHVGEMLILDEDGEPYEPGEFNPKGIAPVFDCGDIDRAVADLAARGATFPDGIVRTSSGSYARLEDPFGYVCFLYEPAAETALRSGHGSDERSLVAAVPSGE